jgi:WD40 repeat protein
MENNRDQPVHLYDAYTGLVRATYRPYNALDEMESPTTLCFANNGQHLVTGGFRTDRMLQVFDLNRPGRDASSIMKLGKTRRSKDGQKGLVSALATSDETNILAVGTYSPGSIYLYDLRAQSTEVAEIVVSGTCVVGHGKSHSRKRKHFVLDVDSDDDEALLNFSAAKVKWYQSRARGGVTQLEFSTDSQYLYSASRRSNSILQWDLRRVSTSTFCPGVASYETDSDTNQRIEFELHNDNLWVGGRDKCIRVYNHKNGGELVDKMECFGDVVNGVSIASVENRTLLAVASGTRHFPSEDDWDREDPHQAIDQKSGGNLQLYDVNIQ